MKPILWKPTLLLPFLCCMAFTAGCSSNNGDTIGSDQEPGIIEENPPLDGSESDASNEEPSAENRPTEVHYDSLENAEFQWPELAQAGLWRYELRLPMSIELEGGFIGAGWATHTTVVAQKDGEDEKILLQRCDDREQKESSKEDLKIVRLKAEDCELPTRGRVQFLTDEHMQYEAYCGDEKVRSVSIKKLSDNSEFNLGHISFNSDQYPDINTDRGVCGTFTRSNIDVYFNGNPSSSTSDAVAEIQINLIEISVPYEDSVLSMEVKGIEEPGEFNLADESSNLEIILSSYEFGTTQDGPAIIHINSGSLSVVEVDEFTFQLAFDLVSSTGDRIHGDISLDLD